MARESAKGCYGNLRVISGPMFSGKTTRLIQHATSFNGPMVVLKSAFDDRYSATELVSHNGIRIPALPICSPTDVCYTAANVGMIFVDEVQFLTPPHFEGDFPALVRVWLRAGIDVTCSGLDLDFEAMPFAVTAYLLAMADDVEKCKARCALSGEPASKTVRLRDATPRFAVGGPGQYEPRANRHWQRTAKRID